MKINNGDILIFNGKYYYYRDEAPILFHECILEREAIYKIYKAIPVYTCFEMIVDLSLVKISEIRQTCYSEIFWDRDEQENIGFFTFCHQEIDYLVFFDVGYLSKPIIPGKSVIALDGTRLRLISDLNKFKILSCWRVIN